MAKRQFGGLCKQNDDRVRFLYIYETGAWVEKNFVEKYSKGFYW